MGTKFSVLSDIETSISLYQKMYINKIIELIWKKDPENYNIDMIGDLVMISDMIVDFETFKMIGNHNIPEHIFYEFYDWKSHGFISERIRSNMDKIKDYNLYHFYMFFMN